MIVELQRTEGFGFDPEILFLAQLRGHGMQKFPCVGRMNPATKVRMFADSLRMFLPGFGGDSLACPGWDDTILEHVDNRRQRRLIGAPTVTRRTRRLRTICKLGRLFRLSFLGHFENQRCVELRELPSA